MKKILLLLLIIVAGCASVETDTITITGIAVNRKGGPAVHADDDDMYFIEDAYSWDEKYVDKKVTVTGVLKVVPNPEPEDKTALVQRRDGTEPYLVIKKAKWALAE